MENNSIHPSWSKSIIIWYSLKQTKTFNSVLLTFLNRLKNVRLTSMYLVVEFLPASSMRNGPADKGSLWN